MSLNTGSTAKVRVAWTKDKEYQIFPWPLVPSVASLTEKFFLLSYPWGVSGFGVPTCLVMAILFFLLMFIFGDSFSIFAERSTFRLSFFAFLLVSLCRFPL